MNTVLVKSAVPIPAAIPTSDPRSVGRLDSWKEIAAYLARSPRCVQRWERQEGMPVHRLPHCKRSTVFAHWEELDQWLEVRAKVRIACRQPIPLPMASGFTIPSRAVVGPFGPSYVNWTW